MAILLNDNLNIAAPKPTDARFGPYADLGTAKTSVPSYQRYIGLTVGVGINPTVEYWWKSGVADTDLIEKIPAVAPSTTISDGDKGDIVVSASGSTWTIDNSAVSLAKMANVATGTVFYRKTAATGAPEVQTLSQLKTDLAITKADVGLDAVNNTSDLAKPISTLTQTALNTKAASTHTHAIADTTGLQTALDAKQATLVSGTNIKTINNSSLLGSGNITISTTGVQLNADWNETNTSSSAYISNKPTLGTAAAQSSNAFASASHSHLAATTSVAGFLSTADKTKLEGIESGSVDARKGFTLDSLAAKITLANNAKLQQGTTDAGVGGSKGIALKCPQNYELKWEGGRLYVLESDGTTIRYVMFAKTPPAQDDNRQDGFIQGSRWFTDSGLTYILDDFEGTGENAAAYWTGNANSAAFLVDGSLGAGAPAALQFYDGLWEGTALEALKSAINIGTSQQLDVFLPWSNYPTGATVTALKAHANNDIEEVYWEIYNPEGFRNALGLTSIATAPGILGFQPNPHPIPDSAREILVSYPGKVNERWTINGYTQDYEGASVPIYRDSTYPSRFSLILRSDDRANGWRIIQPIEVVEGGGGGTHMSETVLATAIYPASQGQYPWQTLFNNNFSVVKMPGDNYGRLVGQPLAAAGTEGIWNYAARADHVHPTTGLVLTTDTRLTTIANESINTTSTTGSGYIKIPAAATQLLLHFTPPGGDDLESVQAGQVLDSSSYQHYIKPVGGPIAIVSNQGPGLSSPSYTARFYGGINYLVTAWEVAFSDDIYTLECWVKKTASPSIHNKDIIFDNDDVHLWIGSAQNPGALGITGGNNEVKTANGLIQQNTWYHVAAVIKPTGTMLFIDGVPRANTFTDVRTSTKGLFKIGGNSLEVRGITGGGLSGYVEEVRITKGIARYNNNFAKPTTAFTNNTTERATQTVYFPPATGPILLANDRRLLLNSVAILPEMEPGACGEGCSEVNLLPENNIQIANAEITIKNASLNLGGYTITGTAEGVSLSLPSSSGTLGLANDQQLNTTDNAKFQELTIEHEVTGGAQVKLSTDFYDQGEPTGHVYHPNSTQPNISVAENATHLRGNVDVMSLRVLGPTQETQDQGLLEFGNTSTGTTLRGSATEARTITLPDDDGTLALLDKAASFTAVTVNGPNDANISTALLGKTFIGSADGTTGILGSNNFNPNSAIPSAFGFFGVNSSVSLYRPLLLAAANTPQLVLHTNQNVGIGTRIPQAKLDISGDLMLSGSIKTCKTQGARASTLSASPPLPGGYLEALVYGAAGNSISLTFNGTTDTVTSKVAQWNYNNPNNPINILYGGQLIPSARTVTFVGGLDPVESSLGATKLTADREHFLPDFKGALRVDCELYTLYLVGGSGGSQGTTPTVAPYTWSFTNYSTVSLPSSRDILYHVLHGGSKDVTLILPRQQDIMNHWTGAVTPIAVNDGAQAGDRVTIVMEQFKYATYTYLPDCKLTIKAYPLLDDGTYDTTPTTITTIPSNGRYEFELVDNTWRLVIPIYTPAVADTVSSVAVGGAPAQAASVWKTQTVSQVLDAILFPTLPPTITAYPSLTLGGTVTELNSPQEVGYNVNNKILTWTLNQGTITNGSGSGTVSLVGGQNSVVGTGSGMPVSLSGTSTTLTSNALTAGIKNWSISVGYNAGIGAYLDNKGAISTVLNASRVGAQITATYSIAVYYPVYVIKSTAVFTKADFATKINTTTFAALDTPVTITLNGDTAATITKRLIDASGTITVPYNPNNQYVGVAYESSNTTKTRYYLTGFDQGDITGLFNTVETQDVTTTLWSAASFKMHITTLAQSNSGSNLQLLNPS